MAYVVGGETYASTSAGTGKANPKQTYVVPKAAAEEEEESSGGKKFPVTTALFNLATRNIPNALLNSWPLQNKPFSLPAAQGPNAFGVAANAAGQGMFNTWPKGPTITPYNAERIPAKGPVIPPSALTPKKLAGPAITDPNKLGKKGTTPAQNMEPLPPAGTSGMSAGGASGKPLPWRVEGYDWQDVVSSNTNVKPYSRGYRYGDQNLPVPGSFTQGLGNPYAGNVPGSANYMPQVAGYYIWNGKYYPLGGVTPGVGIRGLEDNTWTDYWGWWNLGPYLPKKYKQSYSGYGGGGGGYGYNYPSYMSAGGNSANWLLGLLNWRI
jgi:hypothetical protein